MSDEGTGSATIKKGTDRDLNITLEDSDGNPVDVSAATEIKAIFLPESGSALLERTLTGGQVTITNGREKIKVTLSAAFTATMKADEEQTFEIEATVGGKVLVWCFKEALTVVERLAV